MSENFSEQVAQELARIEQLPTDEQAAAYNDLHALLERTLEQTEGK